MKKNIFSLMTACILMAFACWSCTSNVSRNSILEDLADDLKTYYDTWTDIREGFALFALKQVAKTGENKSEPHLLIEYGESDEVSDKRKEMDKIADEITEKKDILVGNTIPTEVTEGTPLKLITPFKITEVSVDFKHTLHIQLIAEAEVEATSDIHVLDNRKSDYYIHINYIKSDGSEVFSNWRCKTSPVTYGMDIPAGTRFTIQETIEESLSVKESPISYQSRLLDTKSLSIQWNPGHGNSYDDGYNSSNPSSSLEPTYDSYQSDDPGMEDDMEGYGTYGLMSLIPEGTSTYTGTMAGEYIIELTIVNQPSMGVLTATYRNVKYGTTMKMIGESLPSDDGDITFIGEENGRHWSFYLTGDPEDIRGTATNSENFETSIALRRKS